jgi:signal transduction histidine kinase
MLDIALTNLFDNAFRYSPNGTVSVLVSKEDTMIKLVIKDSGIGISEEDMPKLFEKFFRGKNAKELDPDESGIGLFTTKRIIEMHKGDIKMESELAKGTTVTVTFPLD